MLMWDDVSMMCHDVLVAIPFKGCLIVFSFWELRLSKTIVAPSLSL